MVDFQEMTDLLRGQTQAINQIIAKMEGLSNPDKWLTIKEAAEYSRYGETSIRRYLNEIKHSKRDRMILIKQSDLDKWIEKYSR